MRSFREHFTTANLLSVEVILISTVWALFINLVDPLTSGFEVTISRLSIVVIIQVILFFFIWLIDTVLIRRIDKKYRPFLLLFVLLGLALARGYFVGEAFYVLGITPDAIIGPRLVASITNQGILIVLLTVSYGLISQSAELRHSLLTKRLHLAQLVDQVSKSNETQNLHSVERVRTMLRNALEIDAKETPERTLEILRDSIDEVIRPFSRALIEESAQLEIENPQQAFKIRWPEALRETLDVRSIQIMPTFALIFMIGLGPSTQLLSLPESFRLYLIVAVLTVATFALLRAMANRFLSAQQSILGFPILLLSASYAAPMIVRNFPEELISIYIFAWYGMILFTGFVPAFVAVALKQSNLLSAQIRDQNDDLEWELVRARATARHNRHAVSTALHGNVQATLSAAVLQLQRAMNAGDDVENALANAKNEAKQSIDFTIDFDKPPVPVQNTINEVTELWFGLSRIENKISVEDIAAINADPICARTVNELIVELCVNALKHANATEISIAGNWINNRVFELVVANNCIEMSESENTAGIGTRLLEELTLGWERALVNDCFVVTARLPWQLEQT